MLQVELNDIAWEPSADFLENSNIARFMARHELGSYELLRNRWISDPAWFWAAAAEDLGVAWSRPPTRTLDTAAGAPWASWFVGGELNAAHLCVDRHDPARLAYVWEGEEGSVRRMTYGELSALVSRVAGGLAALGVGRGDRVAVYMPMIPEAFAAAFACAKLGAVAVPMFSGFGDDAIATRLRDAGARVLIAADGTYRRGAVHDMRAVAGRAVAAAPEVEHVVVVRRLGDGAWEGLPDAPPLLDAVPVPAEHPFLIVYTSGTTGRPKGTVHGHAGLTLKAASELAYHCDQRDGELMFWPSDLGWIIAPWMMVGAGLRAQPLLVYDGAPDHPSPDRLAGLLRRHEVRIFGTSPTYVRSIMRRDDHGFPLDASALRVLVSSGEPWNEAPWRWFFEHVGGGRCPIVNLAGGTESASFLGVLPIRPIKPTSFNSPCVGIDPAVYTPDGVPAADGTVGELVVRQPWPSRTLGFWDDRERYLDTYWSRWPGLWVHGDWARRDADGFWYLLGRSDDTIKVSGKRLGPAEVETVLMEHARVADAAVVGVPDGIKGEAVVCCVVPVGAGDEHLADELREFVAERLGRSFRPQVVHLVTALPKNRSGKLMRRVVRATLTDADPGDLSSLDDPASIAAIRAAISGSGQQQARP